MILSTGPVLQVPIRDLQNRWRAGFAEARSQTLEEVERAHILATLKQTQWVVGGANGAAARLGMNRSTVLFRMKKLGIVKPWKIEE
jgi:formate hydrogenlyase transcriptional activator